MDQTIEDTINKDTQTAGGTKGFSTKQNAVSKYYITAHDRASFLREMRSMVNVRNKGFWHSDLDLKLLSDHLIDPSTFS